MMSMLNWLLFLVLVVWIADHEDGPRARPPLRLIRPS
jgi:hypothetical protein